MKKKQLQILKWFKWIKWTFFLLCIFLLVWLFVMNNTVVRLDYGFGTVKAPLLVTLLGAYLFGVLTSAIPLLFYGVKFLQDKKTKL